MMSADKQSAQQLKCQTRLTHSHSSVDPSTSVETRVMSTPVPVYARRKHIVSYLSAKMLCMLESKRIKMPRAVREVPFKRILAVSGLLTTN